MYERTPLKAVKEVFRPFDDGAKTGGKTTLLELCAEKKPTPPSRMASNSFLALGRLKKRVGHAPCPIRWRRNSYIYLPLFVLNRILDHMRK